MEALAGARAGRCAGISRRARLPMRWDSDARVCSIRSCRGCGRRHTRISTFAYPDKDAAWRRDTVDGVYRSIGQADRGASPVSRESTKATSRNGFATKDSNITNARKSGATACLFATAHLGNWELSAFAHALLTETMNVVVRPLDNPLIDELVETRRALSGNTLLSKRDFARSILQLCERTSR